MQNPKNVQTIPSKNPIYYTLGLVFVILATISSRYDNIVRINFGDLRTLLQLSPMVKLSLHRKTVCPQL